MSAISIPKHGTPKSNTKAKNIVRVPIVIINNDNDDSDGNNDNNDNNDNDDNNDDYGERENDIVNKGKLTIPRSSQSSIPSQASSIQSQLSSRPQSNPNIKPSNKIKKIQDPIYGCIKVSQMLRKFMCHPIFQRLERIKQLGICVKVFPSTNHTRKEHSLGVMHLAGLTVDKLREFVSISDREKELIQLAGLYHDIGHAAFSHMFDFFVRDAITESPHEYFRIKEHEFRSLYLLQAVNSEIKELTPDEVIFVSDVILGHVPDGNLNYYLYEIINNAKCGIDVDKMDYLHRDAHHAGMPIFNSLQHIVPYMGIDRDLHIAFKEKKRMEIANMFNTRYLMFVNIYFNRDVQKMERIYKCAFSMLGDKLFKYGIMTDDMLIEALIRSNKTTRKLIEQIDYGNLDHECDRCRHHSIDKEIKESGNIGQVNFL